MQIETIRRLPNVLTALRLALIPIFVLLMQDSRGRFDSLAVTIFIIAAITDYLDGFIARRWKAVTEFGKLLDPLADKILVMSALVLLCARRTADFGDPWVPAWMVIIILAREFWVTGVRGVAATLGVVVAAGGAGKMKSALQMAAVVFLLFNNVTVSFAGFEITCSRIGLNLLFISIVFSVWGAVQYSVAVFGLPGFWRQQATMPHGESSPTEPSGDAPPTDETPLTH